MKASLSENFKWSPHIEAITKELIVEELVDDYDLRYNDQEVWRLAEVEQGSVSVVLVVEVLLATSKSF